MGFTSSMLDGMRMVREKRKMDQEEEIRQGVSEVGKADVTDVNTLSADDVAKIQAAAAAGQQIGFDGKSGYTIAPTAATNDDGTPTAAQTINAMPVSSFLGQTSPTGFTDQQKDIARTQAIAGIYDKAGDVEGGMRYRQQAQNMSQSATAADRDNQRFGREQQGWKLQDEQLAKDKAWQDGRTEIMNNSPMAQTNAQFAASNEQYKSAKADYDSKIAGGADPKTLGPVPQAPARQMPSSGQMLDTYSALIAHDAAHNKLSTEGLMQFGTQLQKLQDEGYTKALQLANGGASLDDVAKAFNASGQQKFDPKSVISDQVVQDPKGGPPSRVIQFKGDDGAVHSINTLAELRSVNAAQNIVSEYFQNQADKRGQQQLGIAGAHLKLAQDAANSTSEDRDALRTANVAYEKARQAGDDKGMQAATLAVIQAGGTAAGGGGPNDPAEVKLARAMVQSGMAPDMRTGLEMAITKKGQSGDEIHRSFVEAGIKQMMPAEDSVKKADEAMGAMGYAKKGGRWTQGAGTVSEAVTGTFKAGDTRPILGGSNKGKTAVFDGTGWTVKP